MMSAGFARSRDGEYFPKIVVDFGLAEAVAKTLVQSQRLGQGALGRRVVRYLLGDAEEVESVGGLAARQGRGKTPGLPHT